MTGDKIVDGAVTESKIAAGQVVKSLNGLTDTLTLSAGTNVTITPSGNTLTIAPAETDHKVRKGTKGILATPVRQGRPVLQVPKGIAGSRATPGCRGLKVKLVRLVPQEFLAPRETLQTTIGQRRLKVHQMSLRATQATA